MKKALSQIEMPAATGRFRTDDQAAMISTLAIDLEPGMERMRRLMRR